MNPLPAMLHTTLTEDHSWSYVAACWQLVPQISARNSKGQSDSGLLCRISELFLRDSSTSHELSSTQVLWLTNSLKHSKGICLVFAEDEMAIHDSCFLCLIYRIVLHLLPREWKRKNEEILTIAQK